MAHEHVTRTASNGYVVHLEYSDPEASFEPIPSCAADDDIREAIDNLLAADITGFVLWAGPPRTERHAETLRVFGGARDRLVCECAGSFLCNPSIDPGQKMLQDIENRQTDSFLARWGATREDVLQAAFYFVAHADRDPALSWDTAAWRTDTWEIVNTKLGSAGGSS